MNTHGAISRFYASPGIAELGHVTLEPGAMVLGRYRVGEKLVCAPYRGASVPFVLRFLTTSIRLLHHCLSERLGRDAAHLVVHQRRADGRQYRHSLNQWLTPNHMPRLGPVGLAPPSHSEGRRRPEQ